MSTEREKERAEIMRQIQGYYAALVPDRIREAEAVGHVLEMIGKRGDKSRAEHCQERGFK
jgi:hypothetical protein